jgi:ankyrin repeat protein
MSNGERIHLALEERDFDALAALADEGVDLDEPLLVTDAGPRSLLDHALRLGDPDLVDAVLALPGVSASRSLPAHARWSWAQQAPLPVVRRFVEQSGTDPAEADAEGRTLLHEVAAGRADPEVVAWLAAQDGVDADAVAADGATPFFHAAVNGGRAAAELLYAAGADPNPASTFTGWTPLIVAIAEGDDGTVEWLLQLGGVDVNRPDARGATPLHHAVALGRARAADLLRGAGAVDVAPRPPDPALNGPLGDPDEFESIAEPLRDEDG